MRLKPEFGRFLRTQNIQFNLAKSRERIRYALEHDQLQIFYQPVFRSKDGQVSGFEAFLRGRMPDGSLENPSLVPLDQLDSGLGWQVSQKYHDRICADLLAWEQAGMRPKTLALNVIARELMDAEKLASIRARLRATAVPKADLRLQVHGIYLEHPFAGGLKEVICELRRAAYKIVLDNFGMGEISERVLADAPLDYLKIHRKVTAKYAGRNERSGHLENLFGLAARYNFKTIAEGIERSDQLEEYFRLGCTELQGSFLGGITCPKGLAEAWPEGFSSTHSGAMRMEERIAV